MNSRLTFLTNADKRSYFDKLRSEVFGKFPLDALVKQITQDVPTQALYNNNFYLVSEYYDSDRHDWPQVRKMASIILEIVNKDYDSQNVTTDNLLVDVWKALPKYLSMFSGYFYEYDTRKTHIIFMHKLLTNTFTIDDDHIKIASSIGDKYSLCLDTGLIVSRSSFYLYSFDFMISNYESTIQTAVASYEKLQWPHINFDKALSTHKSYYNISTDKYLASTDAPIDKSLLINKENKIIALSSDITAFIHINLRFKCMSTGFTTLNIKSLNDNHITYSPPPPDTDHEIDLYLESYSDFESDSSDSDSDNDSDSDFEEVESEKVESEDEKITKRKSIPSKVRHIVWRKYIGTTMNGKCWCCNDNIKFENWHAGHVVPVSKGGSDSPDNLRPLCSLCNLSMSDTNMFDFIKEYDMKGKGSKEKYNIIDAMTKQ